MATKKRNIHQLLDALVDKEGLKTEVKITMTDATLWKLVGALVLAGFSIALIANLLKNAIPNKQMTQNNELLMEIKKALKT